MKKIILTSIIAFLNFGYILAEDVNTVIDNAGAYSITGRCADTAKTIGVRATISVGINNRQLLVGSSDEKGWFKVKVPLLCDYLVFNAPGYHTRTIRTNFTGDTANNPTFDMSVVIFAPTDKLLPEEIIKKSTLSICFNIVDSVKFNYELYKPSIPGKIKIPFYKRNFKRPWFLGDISEGKYIQKLYTDDSLVISQEPVDIKRGINFIVLTVSKIRSEALYNKKNTKNKFVIFFKQSNHEVDGKAKATLDTISNVLVNDPAILITVTGYTDNVGKSDINLSLSEYRARNTVSYLQERGVSPSQIKTFWKGSDKALPENAPELLKQNSRRVVLELVPK